MLNDASRPDAVRDAALAAEQAYKPHQWTPEQEAELVERVHGTEREWIDRMIAEQNERQRRS
ncbi:hypothetical protein [Microbacterium hydrocarbonoxydans]|nr:hypothetical protein [Microbacterium hydrocarbonoxydans]